MKTLNVPVVFSDEEWEFVTQNAPHEAAVAEGISAYGKAGLFEQLSMVNAALIRLGLKNRPAIVVKQGESS